MGNDMLPFDQTLSPSLLAMADSGQELRAAQANGRTVACACQVCVACTCLVSVAYTFLSSIYAWDSQQLAGSTVVLSRDHRVQKKKLLLKLGSCICSYEVVGSDQVCV